MIILLIPSYLFVFICASILLVIMLTALEVQCVPYPMGQEPIYELGVDAVLGDVGETWFRKDGHVFQLAVSAPDRALQHAWMNEINDHLTAPVDGPEGTSTAW